MLYTKKKRKKCWNTVGKNMHEMSEMFFKSAINRASNQRVIHLKK